MLCPDSSQLASSIPRRPRQVGFSERPPSPRAVGINTPSLYAHVDAGALRRHVTGEGARRDAASKNVAGTPEESALRAQATYRDYAHVPPASTANRQLAPLTASAKVLVLASVLRNLYFSGGPRTPLRLISAVHRFSPSRPRVLRPNDPRPTSARTVNQRFYCLRDA